jgi:hypothetical protein
MKLILSHSYPHPMPENPTAEEVDQLAKSALRALTLYEVRHFEQKYTTTVEFKTADDAAAAHVVTGWPYWDQSRTILEAPSTADGYEFPSIITNEEFDGAPQTVYCSIILED